MLLFAELFLAMSIYVQIPVLRSLFSDTGISSGWETYGLLLFAVGLYLLGGFIEPFFQKYKRNRVCQFSIFMIIVILAGAYFMPEIFFSGITIGVVALLLGVFYGLAQMVLLSTLIIDTTDSFQRTEANYVVSWVLRLALAIGPLVGMAMSVFFASEFFPKVFSLLSRLSLRCWLTFLSVGFISLLRLRMRDMYAGRQTVICFYAAVLCFSRFCLPR